MDFGGNGSNGSPPYGNPMRGFQLKKSGYSCKASTSISE